MNDQEKSERMVNTIMGNLAQLIEAAVNIGSFSLLSQLQTTCGSLFYRASECLKHDITWTEYDDNERINAIARRCLH